MTGPLSGVKIVDLSVAISGPLAVGILADQGADVVKIEQPGIGDIARFVGVAHGGVSAMFQIANRGKRSVVLDLRDARAIDVLLDCAATPMCSCRTSVRASPNAWASATTTSERDRPTSSTCRSAVSATAVHSRTNGSTTTSCKHNRV